MVKRNFLDVFRKGDMRSPGAADAVARRARREPALIAILAGGLEDDDPRVRMRCADALEKVSVKEPALLEPLRPTLRRLFARAEQQELRWHFALMAPRLAWRASERAALVRILFRWLAEDESRIVKVCALQALSDFARQDTRLRARVKRALEKAISEGPASLRARARKLAKR